MYNFLSTLEWQENFWDDIVLPPGLNENRELVIDAITDRCVELRPYYSQPSLFKRMSDTWFKKQYENLAHIWDVLHMEYNPIENYDRTETKKRDYADNRENEGSSTGNSLSSGESKISAYNESTYQPDSSQANSTNSTATSKDKGKTTGNETENNRIHGNIGVTTTQQMINQELELRKINIYEMIAELYESEFFIRCY